MVLVPVAAPTLAGSVADDDERRGGAGERRSTVPAGRGDGEVERRGDADHDPLGADGHVVAEPAVATSGPRVPEVLGDVLARDGRVDPGPLPQPALVDLPTLDPVGRRQ